jgi:uncharacterized YccA/Bax inhibitor family protein
MMRTSNPALGANAFDVTDVTAEKMTLTGTVNKTGILLLILLATTVWSWSTGNPLLIAVGVIGGFIVALVTIFKKQWAPITAPLYAALEGLMMGGISSAFEAQYPGVVLQAVMLTFGTLAALLAAYSTGLIKASQNFKLGVVAATGGIAIFYLVSMVLGFFHINMPLIYGNGAVSIGFSVIVVIVAALNLILDFDFIATSASQGAPKYMEWYAAFGLMITLIWLYLEVLRLLTKLRGNRRS